MNSKSWIQMNRPSLSIIKSSHKSCSHVLVKLYIKPKGVNYRIRSTPPSVCRHFKNCVRQFSKTSWWKSFFIGFGFSTSITIGCNIVYNVNNADPKAIKNNFSSLPLFMFHAKMTLGIGQCGSILSEYLPKKPLWVKVILQVMSNEVVIDKPESKVPIQVFWTRLHHP